jgi:hypothetical protein
MKPKMRVASYLTPLTGETELSLAGGVPLQQAKDELHSRLSELGGGDRVVLVGQAPQGDIQWMDLEEGVHYKRAVDLSEVFKHEGRFFNLLHVAKVALKLKPKQGPHSSLEDAQLSIAVFKVSLKESDAGFSKLKQKIAAAKQSLNVVRRLGHDHAAWNGVCMSGYNRKFCKCGSELLSAHQQSGGSGPTDSTRRRVASHRGSHHKSGSSGGGGAGRETQTM